MRLRALLPLTLFLTLATRTSFAQPKLESSTNSASEYGIDLNRNYSGSEVELLIRAVTEEAEAAVDRAFDEGYKHGLLAAAPDVEYWRVKASRYETEITRLKRERWLFALGGFGAGFVGGGGIGLSVRLGN